MPPKKAADYLTATPPPGTPVAYKGDKGVVVADEDMKQSELEAKLRKMGEGRVLVHLGTIVKTIEAQGGQAQVKESRVEWIKWSKLTHRKVKKRGEPPPVRHRVFLKMVDISDQMPFGIMRGKSCEEEQWIPEHQGSYMHRLKMEYPDMGVVVGEIQDGIDPMCFHPKFRKAHDLFQSKCNDRQQMAACAGVWGAVEELVKGINWAEVKKRWADEAKGEGEEGLEAKYQGFIQGKKEKDQQGGAAVRSPTPTPAPAGGKKKDPAAWGGKKGGRRGKEQAGEEEDEEDEEDEGESGGGGSRGGQAGSQAGPPPRRECDFCHGCQGGMWERCGQLLGLEPDKDKKLKICAHELCALWAPLVSSTANNVYIGVGKEVRRGGKLRCKRCKKKGAPSGCAVPKCRATYHFLCAIEDGCQLDYKKFALLCPDHCDHRLPAAEGAVKAAGAAGPLTPPQPVPLAAALTGDELRSELDGLAGLVGGDHAPSVASWVPPPPPPPPPAQDGEEGELGLPPPVPGGSAGGGCWSLDWEGLELAALDHAGARAALGGMEPPPAPSASLASLAPLLAPPGALQVAAAQEGGQIPAGLGGGALSCHAAPWTGLEALTRGEVGALAWAAVEREVQRAREMDAWLAVDQAALAAHLEGLEREGAQVPAVAAAANAATWVAASASTSGAAGAGGRKRKAASEDPSSRPGVGGRRVRRRAGARGGGRAANAEGAGVAGALLAYRGAFLAGTCGLAQAQATGSP